jgi:hypothetical protein
MPVTEGRKGSVTVCYSSVQTTVAEMGEWTVTGMALPMIEYASFGETVTQFKPGIMNPGEFTFSGYFDGSTWASASNVVRLLSCTLNNGIPISNTTCRNTIPLRNLRLWANADTDLESYGFWGTSESSGSVYITGMEAGTAKDGIGTVTFTGKVATGYLEWSTSLSDEGPASPSESPSESPSLSPSASESPSESPSLSPSASESPSESPSESASESPSVSPSPGP